MNPTEQYLAELDRFLARHLPADLRRSRVAEIRSHLAMDQMERQAAGADADSASRAARQAMGTPSVLARQMVRQDRGYDSAPPLRLTGVCGLALILATTVPFYMTHNLRAYPWSDYAAHWLPFLALVYFGILVLRTRRWLAWPMALWSALAFIGIWEVSMVPNNAVLADGPSQVLGLREAIHEAGVEESVVAAWRSGRTPADRAPVPERVIHAAFYFPLIPFNIPRSMTYYADKVVGPGQAPRLWAANGPAYADELEMHLGRLREALDSAEHPQAARGPSPARVLLAVVEFTVAQTALFAGVNWILLALSAAALRRKTRPDPLLA